MKVLLVNPSWQSRVSRNGAKIGYFYDENFVSNKKMVGELCKRLINMNCGFR